MGGWSVFLQPALFLGSFAVNELMVICKVQNEWQKLRESYFKIQKLVDGLDGSSLRIYGGNNNIAWQLLFKKLRNLYYDAEAFHDYIWIHLSTYCAKLSITSNQDNQLRNMVISSITKLNLPHKIKMMQMQLDELVAETERLANIERITFDDNNISSPSMSSYSLKEPSFVVGRDEEKNRIVNFLSEKCDTNFSVISIMGMVGIGKTTLARHAYNEASFDQKIWVSMSVEFDAVKITKSMIEFATQSACNLSDLSSLQRKLQNILDGRKFLLVLDDYCSENCNVWDTLSGPFQSGSQGSKVIVTTRNMKVSSILGSCKECILKITSDDDCWKIIKQSAMMGMAPGWKESVAMQIATKCKGIPLVATTLGNMLRGKSTKEEWCFVLESELWEMLQVQDNDIFCHLMQGYKHLPTHLRTCFAYCSIFPQGYEFEIDELINLWIGEGYIQSTRAQTSRGLARSYFKDLYSRFFFYECTSASNPNQIRYKMHDLIHGMAQLVSKDICFRANHGESNSYGLFGDARHLSLLHDGIQPLQLKNFVGNQGLRTLLVMSNAGATAILDPELFSRLKFLRVLGLGGTRILKLVDSIEELESLRYLNLTDNPIDHLPKSVCKLVALEILKLRSCPNLRDLPKELCSLINLRHLEFDERVTFMPPHFRRLVNLQYLSAYTIFSKNKKDGYGIEELKYLNCLGGRLYLRNIEISNASEAEEAKLDLKRHLNKLELEWTKPEKPNTTQMIEQDKVLKNLRPHKNLEELVITNYLGSIFPPWLSDASHNLTKIDLNGLDHCYQLPDLGELPSLTFFSISYMPMLRSIGCKFYGTMKFPSLKSFQLRGLSNLTHWEEAHGNGNVMPCLLDFKLNDCRELSRLPENIQKLLSVLTVSGCPKLQAMIPMQPDVEGASRLLCIS